jgi:glycosyltransferase involved in cell wall biosynthesis
MTPDSPKERLHILLSAYACEPGKGSEPGVGWNAALEIAKHHDVLVITRANNRSVIEAWLERNPVPKLRFAYFDLPMWAMWWKRGPRGTRLYYYLWQIGVYFVARRLLPTTRVDVIHHATFVKYWVPSFLSLLPRPFVWGPVGGADSTPRVFWANLSGPGRSYELTRSIAQWFAELDPFLRLTARRSTIALATTEATASRLETLGAADVRILGAIGLGQHTLELIDNGARLDSYRHRPLRLISIGRLQDFKGFQFALRALARAATTNTEYWIVGDGPARRRLEKETATLGIDERVRFLGQLPRDGALSKLSQSDVLIHPSLHESGGLVCLEAMAARTPVVCLDLGGPATIVTAETGIKIEAGSPQQVVRDLADAISQLDRDRALLSRMATASRARVEAEYRWEKKGEKLAWLYREAYERIGKTGAQQ